MYTNKQSRTMQWGGRKGIPPVKTWGCYGGGVAVSSVGVAPTWTVVPLPPFSSSAPQNPEDFS